MLASPEFPDRPFSSAETHAWGVLPQTDHVRMAVGRNYQDATPTAGTLYGAGAAETMKVEVEVTDALYAVSSSVLQAS